MFSRCKGVQNISSIYVKLNASRSLSSSGDFLHSRFPVVDIPRTTVAEYVLKHFGKWSDKVAMECAHTGRRYTYDDIRIKSHKLAKSLRNSLKMQNEDVIALVLPNIPEYPICILGSLLAGLKITTINPSYTPVEIQRQILDANVKTIITLGDVIEKIRNAINLAKKSIPLIGIKHNPNEFLDRSTILFSDLLNVDSKDFNVNLSEPEDVIVMPYSSGTTGLPKGVKLTNMNLVSNISQFHSPVYRYLEETTDTHQDVLPAILPMFHIYGFTLQTLALLQKGCKIVTMTKFSPELYLDCIVKQRANVLMVAPPIIMFLNSHPSVKKEHVQNLRSIMCGAAPLGATDENKIREKVGKNLHIYQGLGLTETSPAIIMIPADQQGKVFGSIGHPLPNTTVKVVALDDDKLQHLGPNQTGELLIKGPQVMVGYHNRPQETKDAFVDGWFRTGDLVRYDEKQMFFVADRIKELIKVRGYHVAPAELEENIRSFEGVAEAAVIGVPHAKNGEAPRAYVVPKQGVTIDTKKLKEHMRSNLASYKQLHGGVVIVDAIPKNPSGKIMRRQLKMKYEESGI